MKIITERQTIDTKDLSKLAKTGKDTIHYPINSKLLNYEDKIKDWFVFVLTINLNGDNIFFYFKKNERTEKETKLKYIGIENTCFNL